VAFSNIERKWLSLINADEGCFSENMFSCLAGDIATRRVLAYPQAIDRERKQAEVVVVRFMAVWRAWTAIASPVEIIGRLLEPVAFGVLRNAFRERPQIGRDVVGRPMMPRAKWIIHIGAEEREASGVLRRVIPF
jgi:hypothetical protein